MKHVLITGAAGAIGRALARAFSRQGVATRLSLVDVDLQGAERLASGFGPEARAYQWDLSKPDTLPDALAEVVEARGAVDTLINCAGIMEVRAFTATDWALADRLMKIDLESPLRLMAMVAPAMVHRRSGVIINVSSMAGVTPLRGCVYYGAAKSGLAMASEIANLELAEHGVHVVTVYPGPVKSELEKRARAQAPKTLIARMLPTGDAEPLAELVMDAIAKKKPRVVYPALYDVASRFPTVASRVTARFSRTPD